MARKRNYAAEYAKLKAQAKAEGISVGKFKKRRAAANAARKAYRDQGRRYFEANATGSSANTRAVLESAATLYQKERSARLAGWEDGKRNAYIAQLRDHVVLTGEYTRDEALERYPDR